MPGQSFFVVGVGRVGKTTRAQRQFPDAPRIDLLDESRYRDYLADPFLFVADLQPVPPGGPAPDCPGVQSGPLPDHAT